MNAKGITRTDILFLDHIVDDTVIVSLLWDEYGPIEKDFVDCWGDCFHQLNTLKTNNEAKNIRRTWPPSAVTAVNDYQSETKYTPGLLLTASPRFTFEVNTDASESREPQRLFTDIMKCMHN